MSKKTVVFFAGLLLCLNVLAWQEVFALSQPRYLEVNFLDVGQGDAEFIETPEGHQILIDGGPNSIILEKLNSLMPFWDKTIDLVILTHPEKDHMTGLLDILQKYQVDYFLWTGVMKNDAENQKLLGILDKITKPKNYFLASLFSAKTTKVLTLSANYNLKAGNTLIDILYPFESLAGKELTASANDTCIVSKIIYGNKSFLFTGDISSKIEKEIVNSGKNILSDVLKVAHHGSKYSTSDLFLQNVRPEAAIIEVGKNSYGHPTPEVLQRLENFGIKIFITSQNGDIQLLSDGNNIKIK